MFRHIGQLGIVYCGFLWFNLRDMHEKCHSFLQFFATSQDNHDFRIFVWCPARTFSPWNPNRIPVWKEFSRKTAIEVKPPTLDWRFVKWIWILIPFKIQDRSIPFNIFGHPAFWVSRVLSGPSNELSDHQQKWTGPIILPGLPFHSNLPLTPISLITVDGTWGLYASSCCL